MFELKLTPCTGCVIGYTVCCDATIADDSASCFSKQDSHDSRALDYFPALGRLALMSIFTNLPRRLPANFEQNLKL